MNSHKRHRQLLRAVFIGVEDGRGGVGDLFIRYLKIRFAKRDSVSVTHEACGGGSYADMLHVARRTKSSDAYDHSLMVWDADRAKTGEDTMPETAEGFDEIISLKPCVEGVLLELLLGKPAPKDSQKCKSDLRAEGAFDHIERFNQRLREIPEKCFRKHREIAKIITSMEPASW